MEAVECGCRGGADSVVEPPGGALGVPFKPPTILLVVRFAGFTQGCKVET